MPETVEVSSLDGPQSEFVVCEKRFPAYVGGRNSGKTVASIFKMVYYLERFRGAYGMFTVPVLGDVDRILLPAMRKHFGPVENSVWEWREKKAEFRFPQWGGTVFVRPATEPDAIRGSKLAFACMDEIAVGNQFDAWTVLEGAVTEDGYLNQIWVTTTPRDVKPWIKHIWKDRVDPITQEPLLNKDDYPFYTAFTTDNPYTPQELKDRAEHLKDTRWGRQEYWGEFLAVSGVAFPDLSEKDREHPTGIEFRKVVIGWDLGEASPTAMVALGLDYAGKVWAFSEFYERYATAYDYVDWLRDNGLAKYPIICDPSFSRENILQIRRTYGLNVKAARSNRHDIRYNVWNSRLAGGGIKISPSCPNLWEELNSLAFATEKHSGDPKDKWVPGCQDHAYDAAAYGLMEFETPAFGRPNPSFAIKGYRAA